MSTKLRRYEEREQMNSYRENEALSHSFTWNIYARIVLHLNILWLKAVNEITARWLRKHDVIKVCSLEYLTTEIEISSPGPFTKL